MALTNIELYEALKKDLNEDAARMIAEVVPQAQDLATKGDVARLEATLDSVEAKLEAKIDQHATELKGYIDSRLLRFTLAFFIPMWGMTAGILGVLLARL